MAYDGNAIQASILQALSSCCIIFIWFIGQAVCSRKVGTMAELIH